MAVPTAPSALSPSLFRKLHPKAYLEKFLSEGIRPDGRSTDAVATASTSDSWRETTINSGSISTAPSSTLVRIGNTTLVCGITLEIAPPEMATPYHGFLIPNIELPPLCSSLFQSGPPSDTAQVLSTRLRDILIASDLLPLSSLIIEPSKAAFVVYLDVVCLNYDGGILDAAVLACVGALRNLVLPKATWDLDTLTTMCEVPDATAKPIVLNSLPLCISFGLLNGHLLADPTLFESELCPSHIIIALSTTASSSKDDLLHVYQAGAPLTTATGGQGGKETLKKCIAMARTRARELRAILEA